MADLITEGKEYPEGQVSQQGITIEGQPVTHLASELGADPRNNRSLEGPEKIPGSKEK